MYGYSIAGGSVEVGWARIEDTHADHPKLIEAGPFAELLDVRAICWSSRLQTDGRIPSSALPTISRGLPRPKLYAQKLVKAGRWRVASRRDGIDGWVIHDFLKLNPSKEERDAERAANAARQRRFRARSNGVSHGVSNA